ncbi:polysaccharide biosynthesis/export family protein [Coraliomargarita sp. W4R53]
MNIKYCRTWFTRLIALVCLTQSSMLCAAEEVYQLSAYDKISISVYGEPDLQTEQSVTDDGVVFLPLLGAVNVGGKTVAQASKFIESELVNKEFLRKPNVTISIEEFFPKIITVMGEVHNPGTIELAPGLNGIPVQVAIAQAGGFMNGAKSSEVLITRAQVPEGEGHLLVVDVGDILSKQTGKIVAPVMVMSSDVVFVPRRVF